MNYKAKLMVILIVFWACVTLICQINVIATDRTTWSITQFLGSCGKNGTDKATWKIMKASNAEVINNLDDAERIVISGTGEMEDYYMYTNGRTNAPWFDIIWDVNSIVVEEGITRIGDNAFIGADWICYLNFPDTLRSIGHNAFSSALDYVKKVIIPKNVTYIGQYAFCSNKFTDVEILGDVTVLQEGVFSSCQSLKSVAIPKSITHIEDWAFDYCTSLKDVYYDGTKSEWEEINIGHGNTYLLNATIHFPTIGVEGISLDKTSKTMFTGSTFKLTATVFPENADNKEISWTSSNESVASVTNGVVTARAVGTSIITATTADGGKTASCIVTIKNKNAAITSFSAEKYNTNSLLNIVVENVPEGAELYIAAYNTIGKLLEFQFPTFTNGGASAIFSNVGVSTFRAFIWNENLNPLSEMKECPAS